MKRQVFNPYLPSWEYIPDGEPHVFGDRLYIFGSHDRFGGKQYCENDYVTWSCPVDDLSDWRYEGIIYKKDQTPWNTDLKPYYAPDVAQGPDGRYYLYYSVQNSSVISVAVCDTPAGKYEYYGDVHFPEGRVHGSSPEDWFDFDPAILVDTDGRVWLYSGSGQKSNGRFGHDIAGCFVMELDQDMLTILEGPKVILPDDWNIKKPNFFEGSSIRHIGDWYYLVYPATDMTGLNYAMSRYPDHGFEWKGRIHSTSDIGRDGVTMKNPRYPMGNNHGGLVCVKGQWYIFDHRMTNGTYMGRQGVAEPVYFNEDGTINSVEATSCGLNGGPLLGKGTYPAYICCNLFRKGLMPAMTMTRIGGGWVTQEGPDYCPPEPTEEHPVDITTEKDAPVSIVHIEKPGFTIGYKYFDLTDTHHISVRYRGTAKGVLEVRTAAEGKAVGIISLEPALEWADAGCDIDPQYLSTAALSGGEEHPLECMPLYFVLKVKGSFDLRSFTLA